MTYINIERLLRESPIPVDPKSIDEVHQRVFERPRRRHPDYYERHEELGHGQFGRVYRATDTRFPREVALKLIPYRGSRQLAWLEREAHALAKLAHPNVVVVHEKGIADAGNYYLATELVPGTRLDAWMSDPSRRLDEILEVFAQAAEGLHHAHERGLVHRDFKPANAIVDQSGRLRILDFGLAKVLGDDAQASRAGADATQVSRRPPAATDEAFLVESRTASSSWSRNPGPSRSSNVDLSFLTNGHVIGTPRYASPEQLEGLDVDPRSDQFSLCVALFEACHGFHPFSGRTSIEIVERIEAKAVTRDRSIRKVPKWLDRLLERGLSPRPEARFESTKDIADALREHIKPPSQLRMGFAAGVLLTVGLGGAVGAWHLRVSEELAGPVGPDAAQREDLELRYGASFAKSLDGYAESLGGAIDAYRESWSRDPSTEGCLVRCKDRFEHLVETLSQPTSPSDSSTVRVSMADETSVLAVLADPRECSSIDQPSQPDQAVVDVLLNAQAKRLVGDYVGARALLEPLVQRPNLRGLPRAVLHYELGTLQMYSSDPDASTTLDVAVASSAPSPEFHASVVSRALEAEIVFGTLDQRTFARLLTSLQAEGLAGTSGLKALAEAQEAFMRGDVEASQRAFATARDNFSMLEQGPYRDYMMAHCALNELYVESNKENPEIDPVVLEGALATVGTVLGDHHPRYLAHGIKVAKLLRERVSADRAKVMLDRLAETFDTDPNGSPSFDLLRLRAETLIADVGLIGEEEADEPTKTAWITRADAIRNALESQVPSLALGLRREIFEIREILFITYATSDAHASALRALDAMRPMATALARQDVTCGYFYELESLMAEKKFQPTGDLLEIEARLQTLCRR